MKSYDSTDIEGYDDLFCEPEWCEPCSMSAESEGIEYTFDFYVKDGEAICEHCGQAL